MKNKLKAYSSILAIVFFFSIVPFLLAGEAPTLSLKDSIPIAEETLTKNQIDPAGYFIFSITYTNSSKGYFWYYTYRPINNPSIGREIHLKIYMDKTVEVLAG